MPIKDYGIFVNGVPIIKGVDRTVQLGETIEFHRVVEFVANQQKNRIRIEVSNGSSLGLNETEFEVSAAIPSKTPDGIVRVIAVGVDIFPERSKNLLHAVDDAKVIARLFVPESGRIPQKSISMLLTSDPSLPESITASAENIKTALESLKYATASDVTILFLSSHGIVDPSDNYYVVPAEARIEDWNSVLEGSSDSRESLLSWNYIIDALQSTAGRRILIVDTCRAASIEGSFDVGWLKKRSAAANFALMAASSGIQSSQEFPSGKHGLYTFALLRSAEEILTKTGRVRLDELADSTIKTVKELVRTYKLRSQTPQKRIPEALQALELVRRR